MSLYPENERLRAMHDQYVLLQDFVNSLSPLGLIFCEHGQRGGLHYTRQTKESIVLRFLGIDKAKIEAENKALLDSIPF